MDMIHAEVYQRNYSESLLTARIPHLENLTIKELMVARHVLAALGRALQARLVSESSDKFWNPTSVRVGNIPQLAWGGAVQ